MGGTESITRTSTQMWRGYSYSIGEDRKCGLNTQCGGGSDGGVRVSCRPVLQLVVHCIVVGVQHGAASWI